MHSYLRHFVSPHLSIVALYIKEYLILDLINSMSNIYLESNLKSSNLSLNQTLNRISNSFRKHGWPFSYILLFVWSIEKTHPHGHKYQVSHFPLILLQTMHSGNNQMTLKANEKSRWLYCRQIIICTRVDTYQQKLTLLYPSCWAWWFRVLLAILEYAADTVQ